MSDFWVITWTSGGFQILHDYNLILGNRLYLILSLLRHAVIRVLLALCSVCRQGETTNGCVCVVSILLPTVLSWYFIWSEHYWTGSSIPNQFRHHGASLSGRNGERWNWKGWASLPDVGHLFCRKGAQSETCLSGICLCLNHSCLYQVTQLPVKFMCSLPPFPLLSSRWSTAGTAQILPVRESAEWGLCTQLPSSLAPSSTVIKLGGGGGVTFLHGCVSGLPKWNNCEEVQGGKRSASLEVLIFSES